MLETVPKKLRFSIYKYLKYLVVFTLIIMFVFTFNFVKPNEIEAFALSSTVIIGILVALSACGLYVLNYESANTIASDVWNKMSDVLKADIFSSVDESTREMTLSDPVFDFMRQYITDFYIVGNMYHSVPSGRVMAPWGISYIATTIDYEIDSPGTAITQEVYEYGTKYEQINFSGKSLDYRFQSSTYQYLYINNVAYIESGEERDDYIFFDVKYYDSYLGQDVHYSNTERFFKCYTQVKPVFIFLYNSILDVMYPTIYSQFDEDHWYRQSFARLENYSYVIGGEAITMDEDVEAIVDGTIVLDPEYDILDRTMPLPYEIGQIIGQTAGDVIAEQWSDVMTIDRYIELYGAIPVTLDGEFEIPDSGTFNWTSLSIPMIELTDKFPFSIPFDLSNAIGNLEAEPVAPDFDIAFPDNEWFGGSQNMDIDFSIFNNLATVLRWIVLTGFVIGLILVTRKLIRG